MIDLHSHILPGVDDGVATLDEARDLARSAVAEGVAMMAATPHVRDDYPTTPEQMEAGVAALRKDFAEQSIGLEVIHGGEIDLGTLKTLPADHIRRFTLGQTGRYLLIEFPYTGWPLSLEATVFELALDGVTPILAHPERSPEVQLEPERLKPLAAAGALLQITAASLDGRLGRSTQRAAKDLLELGLAHLLASDAHSPIVREYGLASACRCVGNDQIARYLTESAPAAVVAGRTLDPPPKPEPHTWRTILRNRTFRSLGSTDQSS